MDGETCPVMHMIEYEHYLVGYRMAERGFLPHAGGWADQPAHWVAALEVVYDAVEQARAELRARQQQSEELH
jgi:hypothetical protein